MKIAFFLDVPRGFGGAASLLLRQAKLMSELYEVIVVIPCDENGNGNEEGMRRCRKAQLPVKILSFGTSFDFRRIDFLGAIHAAKAISEFAEEERITFFHSVQLNIAAELAARRLGIPHLMNVYQMKEADFKLVYGAIYPRYHLCDSQLYSAVWSKNLKIVSRCIRPLPPLCRQRKKRRYKMREFRIIMVGKVGVRKNQLVGIQAVERCLEDFDIKLTIAGDAEGEYAQECQNYVLQKKLQDRIRFLGFVEDIDSLMKSSDCMLCTSVDESFPTSIVEAVTYDTTVVTTPVAGVPELFTNGENGFVSADFSADCIAASLKECLLAYASGEIETIHTNASYTWENHFSPEVIRNQIEQYYCFVKDHFKAMDVPLEELELRVQNTARLIEPAGLEKWMYESSLYYTLLKENIKNEKKAYIWGAGFFGKAAYELLKALQLNIKLEAFVDRAKQGSYCSLPVLKPEEIPFTEDIYVFISFDYKKDEAADYLIGQGLSYNENIWLLP